MFCILARGYVDVDTGMTRLPVHLEKGFCISGWLQHDVPFQ